MREVVDYLTSTNIVSHLFDTTSVTSGRANRLLGVFPFKMFTHKCALSLSPTRSGSYAGTVSLSHDVRASFFRSIFGQISALYPQLGQLTRTVRFAYNLLHIRQAVLLDHGARPENGKGDTLRRFWLCVWRTDSGDTFVDTDVRPSGFPDPALKISSGCLKELVALPRKICEQWQLFSAIQTRFSTGILW